MSVSQKSIVHAACRLNMGAAAAAALEVNNGFEEAGAGIPVDNGAGDWTLTFTQPVDPDECLVVFGQRGTQIGLTAGAFAYGAVVTDTTLQVLCGDGTDAGSVARDGTVDVLVLKVL